MVFIEKPGRDSEEIKELIIQLTGRRLRGDTEKSMKSKIATSQSESPRKSMEGQEPQKPGTKLFERLSKYTEDCVSVYEYDQFDNNSECQNWRLHKVKSLLDHSNEVLLNLPSFNIFIKRDHSQIFDY